ncbi:hypothetical protein L198_02721 [Cryptococcus wingfieldii CBS 7118]|uniref:Uncharacterized protein n=1 Tax=Cryptococcus wingfieldii CBS 7118 TaxID=1295528 RepID=A0A1E3JMA5_9TREE|nr:hypothetical protein L198_02721 [Cryptococcus wingfieldii CBS 7118]ODO01990.1 hypothetical protein L198_02721 [Cryptococcus wingfieldii CBS 7118]
MSTAGPSRSPHPSSRYHPYTLQPSSPQDNPRSQPQVKARRNHDPAPTNGEPPSPPRSRRDPSETPSVSLSMAFGGSAGGKWWDEELRLSSMIHTRLTILQARLSLHQAALAMNAAGAPPMPAEHYPRPPSEADLRARSPERTPSLSTSRDSASASSDRLASPTGGNEYMLPPPVRHGYEVYEKSMDKAADEARPRYWQLPAMSQAPARSSRQLSPLRDVAKERLVSPKETAGRDRSGSGIEMLLDAGMRGLESERTR